MLYTTGSLSARKLNGNAKTRIPPPARSPIKTSLGSSPRRPPSVGPPNRAQGARIDVTPPLRVNRKLDYSANEITPSIEQSPQQSSDVGNRTIAEKDSGAFTIESSPEAIASSGKDALADQKQEPQESNNGEMDDSLPIINGDDSIDIVHNDVVIDPILLKESANAIQASSRDKGKGKQKSINDKVTDDTQDQEKSLSAEVFQKPHKKPGRKPRSSAEKPQEDGTLIEISPSQNERRTSRRAPRKQPIAIHSEEDTQSGAQHEVQAESQSENGVEFQIEDQDSFSGRDSVQPQPQQSTKKRGRPKKERQRKEPPAKKQKTSQSPPRERDRDTQARASNSKEQAESSRELSNRPSSRGTSRAASRAPSATQSTISGFKRPARRTLTLLRQGTPVEEDGARMTRSGRTSVKPFKWWLNEGYEYNKGQITGVTRAEEVENPVRQSKPGRKPGRRKVGRLQSIDEDEEDEDGEDDNSRQQRRGRSEEDEEEDQLDEWEENGGTFAGLVRNYDSYLEAGTREQIEAGMSQCSIPRLTDQPTPPPLPQYSIDVCLLTFVPLFCFIDIAFASTSFVTQDVASANFRYAKIVGLPFFGCGILELPPGGFKKVKNSRRMQMVFFMHTGRITVQVADHQFSIGKGGIFQVPRGTSCKNFEILPRISLISIITFVQLVYAGIYCYGWGSALSLRVSFRGPPVSWDKATLCFVAFFKVAFPYYSTTLLDLGLCD